MCVLYMFFVQTMFNYDTCFPFLFKLLTFLCCLLSFSVDARFAGGDYILAGCRRIEPLGRSSVHRSSRRLFHFFNMQILYTIYICDYVCAFAPCSAPLVPRIARGWSVFAWRKCVSPSNTDGYNLDEVDLRMEPRGSVTTIQEPAK